MKYYIFSGYRSIPVIQNLDRMQNVKDGHLKFKELAMKLSENIPRENL